MSGLRWAEGRLRPSAWTAAAAAGALLAAGCATAPKTGRVTYVCERGPRLTVIFEGGRARLITPGGPPVELQRRRALTGFWYESSTHSIRGRGQALTYTVGRMTPMRCRAVS
ncbi:hypothetical protein [Sphingosinicella sp. CPCC 101087]|uniref:hypothetical protein n=1 Tax=Sphingosinicella sp. CPCC 101087 TaxID=2497754 RepID=UPI00101DC9A3|nr:hypothetical protein [Sphingosinicella sp. CPCC 101087]